MRSLGKLEAAVMQLLWTAQQPVSVREAFEALGGDKQLAYTTVMTVMDNLHTKAMVTRTREGRAYIYTAAISRADYTAGRIADATEATDDRAGALLQFIGQLSPSEVTRIRESLNDQPASHSRRRR